MKEGLVRAYIGMQKMAEAAAIAREAYKMSINNPKVLTLYGLVLSHLPHTHDTVQPLSPVSRSLPCGFLIFPLRLAKYWTQP